MLKKYLILAINPGSTSTKIALYENETPLFEEVIRHNREEVAVFASTVDQYDYRLAVINDALAKHGVKATDLSAVVGRGGPLKSIPSGTYIVNDKMVDDLRFHVQSDHASRLGGLLARGLAETAGVPAFIVDPVSVDEMEPIARLSGLPDMPRRSLFHALNIKAMARRAAKDIGKPLDSATFILAHLGGGISVAIQQKGRVIDVDNPQETGTFSPERAGGLPTAALVAACFSGKYTMEQMTRRLIGGGGLVAYLDTDDAREVERRIEAGDKEALLVFEAMAYQISKAIAAMATVVCGEFDAIVLTGGLAYSQRLVNIIKERVSFLGKVLVYPGEDELEALSAGALRVVRGEEIARVYE